jgi:hypothetical protein
VRYYLYHVQRTQRRERGEKKGGIFVRHPTTAMATGERYLFFQINRLHRCLFLLALFFSCVCMRMCAAHYTTTITNTTTIIHLTSERCFLRSMYESARKIHVQKYRSLRKRPKKIEERYDDAISIKCRKKREGTHVTLFLHLCKSYLFSFSICALIIFQ